MSIDIRGITALLQVFDMPASLRFHRDLLGFQIIGHAPPWKGHSADHVDWVWLRRDTVDLMLNTAYERDARPASPDGARRDADENTALYMTCPDLEEAFRYLQQCGFKVRPPVVSHYGMQQLSLNDPDGYHLCLQWRA